MLGQALARTSTTITNIAQLTVLIGGALLVIVSSGHQLSPGGLMAAYLMLMRLYMPEKPILDGTWSPPTIERISVSSGATVR